VKTPKYPIFTKNNKPMQRFIQVLLISISTLSNINAQDSGLSFELHYPTIFVDENNDFSDVQGVFGGTIQYQLSANDKFNYGVEYKFDISQVKVKLSDTAPTTNTNILINHINVFSKIDFDEYQKFRMYVNVGFTTYKNRESSNSQSFNGFNGGLGLSYEMLDRVYLHTSFDYIKAFKKVKQTDIVETESQQIIRIGLGFKL